MKKSRHKKKKSKRFPPAKLLTKNLSEEEYSTQDQAESYFSIVDNNRLFECPQCCSLCLVDKGVESKKCRHCYAEMRIKDNNTK